MHSPVVTEASSAILNQRGGERDVAKFSCLYMYVTSHGGTSGSCGIPGVGTHHCGTVHENSHASVT